MIAAPLKEEFVIICKLPEDPLSGLLPLPTHPPKISPGTRFTQERSNTINLNPARWLWPEELKLVHWIVHIHEMAFAWIPTERGCLDKRFFPLVKIPTIPHFPWVLHNIPIPPAIQQDAIQIIKDHIASGVYEPSTAAYCLRWFCVVKQDGKSLHLVHDLQPLNAVTIPPPLLSNSWQNCLRAMWFMV